VRRVLKYASLILFGVLLPLALLEVGLQVGAFIKWRQNVSRNELVRVDSDGRTTVLCVGDSFTYGSGSSSYVHSYPGELETILNQDAKPGVPAWRVINAGCPGRNSSELVQVLPDLLKTSRPAYVCVLVGTNNQWSTADRDRERPHSSQVGEGGAINWCWRLRTKRFLAIAIPASIDRWQEKLKAPPKDAERIQVRIARLLVPADAARQKQERGTELFLELDRLRAMLDERSELPAINEGVDRLRSQVWATDNLAATELFIQLVRRLRRHHQTIQECELAIDKYGKRVNFAFQIMDPLIRLGRPGEAVEWGEFCLSQYTEGFGPPWINRILSTAMEMVASFDDCLRYALLAFASDLDEQFLSTQLRRIQNRGGVLEPQDVEDLLVSLTLPTPVETHASGVVRRLLSEMAEESTRGDPAADALERDLDWIVDYVRSSGAEALFLTYPRPKIKPSIVEVQKRSARRHAAHLVDLSVTFEALLKKNSKEAFFIPDWHCNDAGYRIVAELVAEGLRKVELQRRSRQSSH